jgi:hypothetical protein
MTAVSRELGNNRGIGDEATANIAAGVDTEGAAEIAMDGAGVKPGMETPENRFLMRVAAGDLVRLPRWMVSA